MGKKAINPINNGTAIDHIPAGKGKIVWEMLDLISLKEKISLGVNLTSNKLGRKDMLMFENLELTSKQLNAIALVAPDATISIIRKKEIIKKIKVSLPDFVERIITCPNPHCITNLEAAETKFKIEKEEVVKIRCYYCEKEYLIKEVKIKM